MENIQIKKSDFNKILNTAEILINEVEEAFSQEDIIKKRMEEIKTGKVNGKTEEELDEYLKKRGVKIERLGNKRAS